jgi:diaminopimelate decarboxylase
VAENSLAPRWLREPADPNGLSGRVWPASARRASTGALELGGVGADALAREYGTPLYVVDETEVRRRAAEARDAFEGAFAALGGRAVVYYAGKAFLSTELVRWIDAAGLRLDVCSGGELAVALAAGFDPARIGYHGNNKSLAEIDEAVAVGVGAIVIDSAQEIERVADAAARHGRTQAVRLRVSSGVHAHTHEFLATAHEDQKFGLALADAEAAVEAIRSHAGLEFLGLHCHIGSQIFGVDGFTESASRLLDVHARLLEGGDVPELNLGGGFGIAYTDVDDPSPLAEIAAGIARAVAEGCAERGIALPVIAVEPGRAIVGPAGVTLYTVGTTKPVEVTGADGTIARRLYVSVDGGMSDNVRTALYQAEYTVRIASRESQAPSALVRVAGKHCESGDIVVNADYLPADVGPGDLLAVPATGAYCWSLSSRYNYLPRPAVVSVADGSARVLVRGETRDDLLSHDTGVDHDHASGKAPA